jgi:aspartate aminotransferase
MFARVLSKSAKVVARPQSLRSATSFQQKRGVAFWGHVEMGPADPILGVADAYKKDTDERKVNVGVGAYRDDDGKPWVLPSVREAEKRITEAKMDMEYSPIGGAADYVNAAKNLAYGADSDAVQNNRVAILQSLSGTGALRLSAQFFSQFAKGGVKPIVMVPNPTWGNHFPIYGHAGIETTTYRYWKPETKGIDFEGMIEDLKAQPNPAVVLLHSCAHNPTGVDPNAEQWAQISQVCKEQGHFVLFDNAYQGFASGDTEKDVAAVRHFIDDGHNIALCQSFAKNFGLYGQRVGAFSILCQDADEQQRVESQLKIIARAIYSNPPLHGARIVSTILNDPTLNAQWRGEIAQMSGRINTMRSSLKSALVGAGSKHNWEHITDQIGMFSYTGLTVEQCKVMTDKHHIYLTSNGRISMAGVTSKNVDYLGQAMHDVTK